MPARRRIIIDDDAESEGDDAINIDHILQVAGLDSNSKAVSIILLATLAIWAHLLYTQLLRELQLQNQALHNQVNELKEEVGANDRRGGRSQRAPPQTNEEYDVEQAARCFTVMEYPFLRTRLLLKPSTARNGTEKAIVEAYRAYLPSSVGERASETRIVSLLSQIICSIMLLNNSSTSSSLNRQVICVPPASIASVTSSTNTSFTRPTSSTP